MLIFVLIVYLLIGLGVASKYATYCKNHVDVNFTIFQWILMFFAWPVALGWLLYTLFIKFCVK